MVTPNGFQALEVIGESPRTTTQATTHSTRCPSFAIVVFLLLLPWVSLFFLFLTRIVRFFLFDDVFLFLVGHLKVLF